jgi:hypothetical protein
MGPVADALVLDQVVSARKAARELGWSPKAKPSSRIWGKNPTTIVSRFLVPSTRVSCAPRAAMQPYNLCIC